jgi:hypothetical protein
MTKLRRRALVVIWVAFYWFPLSLFWSLLHTWLFRVSGDELSASMIATLATAVTGLAITFFIAEFPAKDDR